jgi:pimeloyl-ACP methyl ester carboxylesterase
LGDLTVSDRPTLYLLCGLLCDAYTFEKQKAALSARFDVRVVDFFGLDSMEAMARKVLDAAPPRFSICGFSMGGRVALKIMAMAPERVERLMLLDTGVTPVAEGEAEKRLVLVDLAKNEGIAALRTSWLLPMLHPDRQSNPAFTEPLGAMIERATPEIFDKQQRALLGRPDAQPVLPTIACPTYVVVGRQDAWSTVAQHEDFAKLIPDAKLVVIEDSGHFVPVEQPDALNRLLVEMMETPARA